MTAMRALEQNRSWRRVALSVAVIALAFVIPATTSAQQPGAPLAALSAPARLAIRAAADSLTAEGLPGDALVAKAAEGLLKGATEDRIVVVVHRLASDIRAAGRALGSDASAGEIVAAAGALRAGASPELVRELRSAAGASSVAARRPLVVALVVLGDLVSRGASPSVAASSVTSLVQRHASDDELQALRAAVERDIDAGSEPGSAAIARSRALVDSLGGVDAARTPRNASASPRTAHP
jgi:hypothetical protein